MELQSLQSAMICYDKKYELSKTVGDTCTRSKDKSVNNTKVLDENVIRNCSMTRTILF